MLGMLMDFSRCGSLFYPEANTQSHPERCPGFANS
jgi:hypothetical protein